MDLKGKGPWGARLARTLVVAALSFAAAGPAAAQFCPGCIQNSAAPQNAQMNIGTATVRGTLTVGTLNLVDLTMTGTLTAAQLVGAGSGITAINASALASGTVPSARVAGSYTGITGVGTVAAGTWQGVAIAPAYGGTGANLSISGTAGAIPYFTGSGILAPLVSPSGVRVLQTAGSGAAPIWTNAPTLVGTNFSAIPLTALANGTLQAGVQVPNASLVAIDAAKVNGNIAGGAAFLTVALPIGNLAAGTLPTTNAASSVTVTGTPIGTFGGPTTLAQIRVGGDGRIYDAKQFNLVVYSTQVFPGPLPPGVTIPAAQITSGTLANNVIASSVAATGIAAGVYGNAAQALTATVMVDGRLSAITAQSIALPPSQLTAGTLPGTVLVPAANINAGTLGPSVIAQKVSNSGVVAGTYGSPTIASQLTINAEGRVTNATQFSIPGVSTRTAFIDVNNQWHGPTQVSDAAWFFNSQVTVQGPLVVTAPTSVFTYGVLASTFAGNGAAITHLTAANIDAGTLGPSVIASSVAVRKVGDLQLTTTGVVAGTKGTATRIPTVVVDAQGRITSLTDQTVAISTGEFTGIVQTAQGGTGNNWSATAANGIPYFSGLGTLGVLPTGTGVLQTASGAPAYTLVPTLTATNITGVSGITGLGTQAQILNMGSHRITNVTDPSADQDAATKFYVDSIASGIQWKSAGRLATTAALPANSYSNGSSGVGATLTGLAIGALTIDSVVAVVGNRILVKDEVAGSHNGIYTVTQTGAGVVYILTRATDYDTATEMDYGTALFITAGTVNADSGFVQINSIATVGTDALAFTQFTGLGEVTAGNGLQKSANTISIISPVTTINGGTGVDWSAVTAGRIPYFTGTGALGTLATSINGYTLVQAAGIPAWAAAVSSATNVVGGAANSIHYQSAPNTTAMLAAGSGVIQEVASGAPAWTLTPTLTGTNFSAIPAATALTGQVPIANGGTNLSSAGGTANRVLRTSDGTTFAMGQIIGPDIAASTIPASAINQSGAATTNVLAWNGSNWAPSAAASGDVTQAGPNTFTGLNTHAASSTDTFNGSISSNTALTANALYAKMIPKISWIGTEVPSAVTTYGALGVTSATYVTTGVFTLSLATAMSGTRYACTCTPCGSLRFCSIDDTSGARATNLIRFRIANSATNGNLDCTDANQMIVIQCWDYGSTAQ